MASWPIFTSGDSTKWVPPFTMCCCMSCPLTWFGKKMIFDEGAEGEMDCVSCRLRKDIRDPGGLWELTMGFLSISVSPLLKQNKWSVSKVTFWYSYYSRLRFQAFNMHFLRCLVRSLNSIPHVHHSKLVILIPISNVCFPPILTPPSCWSYIVVTALSLKKDYPLIGYRNRHTLWTYHLCNIPNLGQPRK